MVMACKKKEFTTLYVMILGGWADTFSHFQEFLPGINERGDVFSQEANQSYKWLHQDIREQLV